MQQDNSSFKIPLHNSIPSHFTLRYRVSTIMSTIMHFRYHFTST